MVVFRSIIFFVISISFLQCAKPRPPADPAYIKTVMDWHDKRIERLRTSPNSWLNLAGLFWLKEGRNRFGSDKKLDVVFPEKAPAFCGIFYLKNGQVKIEPAKGLKILNDGKPISEMKLRSNADSNTTVLELGSLRWFIIKRGDKVGVRLRDVESPLLKEFTGIETYPIDAEWRVEATLEPYNPVKFIPVPNILGTIDSMESPGVLRFDIDGKTYRIDPVIEEKSDTLLFIIFGDQTNGNETYGGGRFVYIPFPDANGKTFLDFNRAYNPPCVFTDFATCPLPPPQNKLAVKIFAGEKKWSETRH